MGSAVSWGDSQPLEWWAGSITGCGGAGCGTWSVWSFRGDSTHYPLHWLFAGGARDDGASEEEVSNGDGSCTAVGVEGEE